MSYSPPRRLSAANNSSRQQEELINAYEAEEERIINLLSRKLEQLRQEKIGLENALEAESESHVNRLSKEIYMLKSAQQRQQQASQASGSASFANGALSNSDLGSGSPEMRIGLRTSMNGSNPADPSPQALLETLRRENDQLRNKLVDTEREFIRTTRLNEIYREELIDHRRRLGLPVDNLIDVSSDPLSQPTHRRPTSYSTSNGFSPSTSAHNNTTLNSHSHPQGVPIPRATQTHHRPPNHISSSELNTPLSHSPASSESPFPFSPTSGATNAASYASGASTDVTSPPSSTSLNHLPPLSLTLGRGLSYPSVPPPSLSSSFGSPTVSFHMPHRGERDASLSPIESLSRRNSTARHPSLSRGGGTGGGGSGSSVAGSRRASLEFGGRVAETGSLIPRSGRSRAGSQSAESQLLEATRELEIPENNLGVVSEVEDPATAEGGGGSRSGQVSGRKQK